MIFPLLHTFTVFSSFPIIIGDVSQRSTAAAIDQLVTDGGLFVKRIVHGEKITDNPGYLLFTAPLKLCKGSCEDGESNFAMVFPIYIGKKGKNKYKELYERDFKNIHSTKLNAPFKKQPTKKWFTLCPIKVTKQITTTTTESETTTTTETSTMDSTTHIQTYSQNETPATEASTNSETETTAIDTSFIELPTTNKSAFEIETTEAVMISEMLTTAPKIDTLTISVTDMLATDEPTVTIAVTTKTKTTTAKKTTIPETKIRTDQIQMFVTEAPTFLITESEDIAFESYTDYNQFEIPVTKRTSAKTPTIPKTKYTADQTEIDEPKFSVIETVDTDDVLKIEDIGTSFATNAQGYACPPRICKKKKKATVVIIRNNKETEKKMTKTAQWDSDYSDF